MSKIRTAIAVIVAALTLTGCGPNPGHGPARPRIGQTASTATTPATTKPTTPAATPTTRPPTRPTSTPPVIGLEQQNATRAAESYLEGQSFSRSGLIDQLKYEGYSSKSATAAVDSLHADWSAQAALVAKSYLDGQAFSRSGLVAQLKYEGFSNAQAVYGVTKAGL